MEFSYLTSVGSILVMLTATTNASPHNLRGRDVAANNVRQLSVM